LLKKTNLFNHKCIYMYPHIHGKSPQINQHIFEGWPRMNLNQTSSLIFFLLSV